MHISIPQTLKLKLMVKQHKREDSSQSSSFLSFECHQNLPYAVPEWDAEDEDDITELCEEVYRNSAQCNANFDDFNWVSFKIF